jgi:phage host-nuclease inhibitor protein Gam
MLKNDIQNEIYELGNIMYKIGRLETDEKASTKEYNIYCKKREELTKKIDEFFKNLK